VSRVYACMMQQQSTCASCSKSVRVDDIATVWLLGNKIHTTTLARSNKAPTIEIAFCFSEYLQKKCCGRERNFVVEKVLCTTQCLCQTIPQSVCVKRPSKRDDLPTDDLPTNDLQFFLSCSKIQGVQPCLPAPLPHILILACHKFKRPRLEMTSHAFVDMMCTRRDTSHKDLVEIICLVTSRRGRGLAVPQVIKTMTRHHKS